LERLILTSHFIKHAKRFGDSMNKNSTKNFKVFTLILLTSMLLLVAVIPNVPVKAATTDAVYVYSTIGGTIAGNGTALTGGSSPTYANGAVVAFTETPSSGFQFLNWIYINGTTGATTSTSTKLTTTITQKTCAIEAMFLPTTNATQTTTGTGTATIDIYFSAGGTTVPASPKTYTDYTIGTSSTFTAVPSSGFKFLYWVLATSTVTTYTSAALTLKIPAGTCAMQAFFVPTSSSVTLPTPTPKINEFSTATTIILVLALVIVAFGTYAYTKKAKK
jgi:hypothetical protein